MYEGFLRNELGEIDINKREERFFELARKAIVIHNTNTVENVFHFINIVRKVYEKEVVKFTPFQSWKKQGNKEQGYKRGTTEHSEGWN